MGKEKGKLAREARGVRERGKGSACACALINMQIRDICKTSGCQIISNQNRISLKRRVGNLVVLQQCLQSQKQHATKKTCANLLHRRDKNHLTLCALNVSGM